VARLETLTSRFALEHGAVVTTAPIRLQGAGWQARLSGRLGREDRLAFVGEVTVDPSFVHAVTGLPWLPVAPMTLPIMVRGTLERPVLEGITEEAVLRALARGDLRGIARLPERELRALERDLRGHR
jgi:hypothetical protein